MGVALREARKDPQAVNWAHGQREGDRLIRMSIILLYSVMERLVIEPQDAPDEWLEVIRAYRHAMVHELENQGLLPVLTRRKVDGAIMHQCGEHSVLMRRTDATAKKGRFVPTTIPDSANPVWRAALDETITHVQSKLRRAGANLWSCDWCTGPEKPVHPSADFDIDQCGLFGSCRGKKGFRYPCEREFHHRNRKGGCKTVLGPDTDRQPPATETRRVCE